MSKDLKKALTDYAKTFGAALLTAYSASGKTPFTANANDLKQWITAAVTSILPVLIYALTPTNGGYGKQKTSQE